MNIDYALQQLANVKMRASIVATVAAAIAASAAAKVAAVPTLPLLNSAAPGQKIPAVGLGTGAYSNNAAVGYEGYPECWVS